MEFQSPEFLWLMLLIPLFAVLYIFAERRRSNYTKQFANLSMVKEAIDASPKRRRFIPPILFLIGLTLLLFAMSRPSGVVFLPRQEGTVILAIDVSRSMSAGDIRPTRLEAAKAAARTFINNQGPNVRIGIVSFSGNASLVQEPTTNHADALAAVNRLQIQNSTAIGSAIVTSLDAIAEDPIAALVAPKTSSSQDELLAPTPTPTPLPKGTHAPATVVLLTDGRNRTGPDPIESAHTAADRGVRVYTVGVGTTNGGNAQGGNNNRGGGRGNPGFGGNGNQGFGNQGLGGNGNQGFGQGGFGGNQGGFGGGGNFRADLDTETLQQIADITDAQFFMAEDAQSLLNIYRNIDKQIVLTRELQEQSVFFAMAGLLFFLIGGATSLVLFNRLP